MQAYTRYVTGCIMSKCECNICQKRQWIMFKWRTTMHFNCDCIFYVQYMIVQCTRGEPHSQKCNIAACVWCALCTRKLRVVTLWTFQPNQLQDSFGKFTIHKIVVVCVFVFLNLLFFILLSICLTMTCPIGNNTEIVLCNHNGRPLFLCLSFFFIIIIVSFAPSKSIFTW